MNQTIRPQISTNVIDDSTLDTSPVIVTEETPVNGDFVISADRLVKGSGLTVVCQTPVTLGQLKQELSDIDAQILKLANERVTKQALFDSVSVEMDIAITAVLNSGGVDNRTQG